MNVPDRLGPVNDGENVNVDPNESDVLEPDRKPPVPLRPLAQLERCHDLGWHLIPCHSIAYPGIVRTPYCPDIEFVPLPAQCSCRLGSACEQPGKHPFVTWKDRTERPDKAQIRSWYEEYRYRFGGWPPNWGVILGRSGLCALDVDQHVAERDGLTALARLIAEHGPLSRTCCDSRGHYLFRHPPGLKLAKTSTQIAPGLEFLCGTNRADHLLYIPPSRHRSGYPYLWIIPPWDALATLNTGTGEGVRS